MELGIRDKIAIVTGGSGLIGSAVVQILFNEGAKVAIFDLNDKAGEELRDSLDPTGRRVQYVNCNIGDADSVHAAFDAVVKRFGTVDLLFNNAGINVSQTERLPLDEFHDDAWQRIYHVNVGGSHNCTQAALPIMRRNGGGRIVYTVSVVGGVVPFRNQCVFAATKASILNYARTIAMENARYHIAANAVAPGSTPFKDVQSFAFYNNDAKRDYFMSCIPAGRGANAFEIASALVFLSSPSAASYVTGTLLVADGGWTAGYPRTIEE